MMWLLLTCALWLMPVTGWAAIAVDAASGNTKASGGGTSITVSHTATGTGTDGLLLAFCDLNTGGGTDFSGMTWNGSAMTQLQTHLDASTTRVSIWYKKAPAAGTFNMVATATNDLNTTCHTLTLTGVDQSTTFGTAAVGNSTNSVPSVTVTTATGELVVDIVGWNVSAGTAAGANQTQRDTARTIGSTTSSISTQAGVDGGVMSWVQNGTAGWVQIAVPVKAAAGGATGCGKRLLMGVGC